MIGSLQQPFSSVRRIRAASRAGPASDGNRQGGSGNMTEADARRTNRGAWLRPIRALAVVALACAGCGALASEGRIALVVGNAAYPAAALNNPENDARLVAATLRQLGFDVSEHVNLGALEFRRVLREFARRARDEEGVVVFYYAGHGMQIGGRDYLVPVDVDLRDQDEVRDDAVDVDELLLRRLSSSRARASIVILDACRDNPFSMATTLPMPGAERPRRTDTVASAVLIAYASAPGEPAQDGPPESHSVYTRHLVEEMLAEGVEVERMFKNVRIKVQQETQRRQLPWVDSSLTTDFEFNPARLRATTSQTAPITAGIEASQEQLRHSELAQR
jgi:uncharacterized caspase-like protein